MTLSIQLSNMKAYIKKKIAEVDSKIDTRDQTGVGDILIKPLEFILQPIADELIRIDRNQSLRNGAEMTEDDLDALVANLFVTRVAGSKSRGQVRLFFSEPVAMTIPAASEFTSGDGLRFFALSDTTITANQMLINKDGDFYYVDVLVESETVGSQYNVLEGSIIDYVGGPSSLLKVDNPTALAGGSDKETNPQLLARSKEAVTVRDLVSKPAIRQVLLENFTFLKDLRVVGYGDVEMERDFLVGQNLQLGLLPPVDFVGSTLGMHIGGKVDVHLRITSLAEESLRIDAIREFTVLRPKDAYDPPVDPGNVSYLSLIRRPVIDLVRLQQIDPATANPIGAPLIRNNDYRLVVDNRTLRFSVRDRARLQLMNSLFAGSTFVLTYQYAPEVGTVQEFIDADSRRVVTADILSKFTNPAFVDLAITYSLSDTATITEEELEVLVVNFINSLPVGARLEASDLVDVIYDNGGGFVQLPFTMTATLLKSDGTEEVITSQNAISVPATAAFLPRNIILTRV